MEVLFATNNQNKLKELQSLVPAGIKLITLSEAGLEEELPEPFESLEENARSKISHALIRTGMSAGFSEDSGLFIQSLDGRPGVHSAHYAGPQRNDSENIQRVLEELINEQNRSAFFQTTICLIWEGEEHFFTGICEGNITHVPVGSGGFGYDPIFVPTGADRSFGQMDLAEKNQYSHRKKAVLQMIDFFHQWKKSN